MAESETHVRNAEVAEKMVETTESAGGGDESIKTVPSEAPVQAIVLNSRVTEEEASGTEVAVGSEAAEAAIAESVVSLAEESESKDRHAEGTVTATDGSAVEKATDSESKPDSQADVIVVRDAPSEDLHQQPPEEPNSNESGKSSHSFARSQAEEEILSTIEDVKNWAEEDEEEEEEDEEDEEEEGEEEGAAGYGESVDYDRDRKNPQYIPRSGDYYLHDDRDATDSEAGGETEESIDVEKPKRQTGDVSKSEAVPGKVSKRPLKKVPTGKSASKEAPAPVAEEGEEKEEVSGGKWKHDLFEQIGEGGARLAQGGGGPRRFNSSGARRGGPRGGLRDQRRGARYPTRSAPSTRPYRGGRGGSRAPPVLSASEEDYIEEPEVIEKENVANKGKVKERHDELPQESFVKPKPRENIRPARGGGNINHDPHGRAFRDARELLTPRTPRVQNVEDWDYEEEEAANYRRLQQQQQNMNRGRGRGAPPAYRRQTSNRSQYSEPEPRFRYQEREQYRPEPRYADDYGDDNGSNYQSRVFFSRGRGPRRGQPDSYGRGQTRPSHAPPPARGSRASAVSHEVPRHEPPSLPPPQRPAANLNNAGGGRVRFGGPPVVNPPPRQQAPSAAAAPQTKRYSQRVNPNQRGDENKPLASDDVRNTGLPAGGGGGGGGGVQRYPGHYNGPAYQDNRAYQMAYPLPMSNYGYVQPAYVDPYMGQYGGGQQDYYQPQGPQHPVYHGQQQQW